MSDPSEVTLPAAWEGDTAKGWAKKLAVPFLEIHPTLPSTNAHLRRRAREGVPSFTTIIAGTQTEGRGREGRSWHSPPDSGLWISVFVPVDEPGAPGVLPLAAGVAAALAVERVSGLHVSIKWPNDLLVGDRKVAGILCEAAGDGAFAAVGVGVNIRPPSEPFPTELASSAGFVGDLSTQAVSEPALAAALIQELRRWARPTPRALLGALRTEWESRDYLAGRRVRVESGVIGVASGVSKTGELQITLEDGASQLVRAGSVRLEGEGESPALQSKETEG